MTKEVKVHKLIDLAEQSTELHVVILGDHRDAIKSQAEENRKKIKKLMDVLWTDGSKRASMIVRDMFL